MTRCLTAAVLALLLLLALARRPEPEPIYIEDDDGIAPPDPYLSELWRTR